MNIKSSLQPTSRAARTLLSASYDTNLDGLCGSGHNANTYHLKNNENKLILPQINLELIILREAFRTAELSCGTTCL